MMICECCFSQFLVNVYSHVFDSADVTSLSGDESDFDGFDDPDFDGVDDVRYHKDKVECRIPRNCIAVILAVDRFQRRTCITIVLEIFNSKIDVDLADVSLFGM